MKEIKANILSKQVLEVADAICITTNGVIKRDGKAVMGAGVAKSALNFFSTMHLDKHLAEKIQANGHVTQCIRSTTKNNGSTLFILSFPTKQDWKEASPLWLIERSTKQLVALVEETPQIKNIWLPRPGCANGGLNWEKVVRPVVEPLLDDRFTVCYL